MINIKTFLSSINFSNSKRLIIVFLIFTLFSGCGSLKLHERKKIESSPTDSGSITELELRGPRAQVSHKF